MIKISRTRDPTRQKAYVLWLQYGGKKAPKGTLAKIARELGTSDILIRKWKFIDSWDNPKKKKTTVTNGNKKNVTSSKKDGTVTGDEEVPTQLKAKAMYLGGTSNSEIQTELNIKRTTLDNWIRRYHWLKEKEDIYIKIQDELQEKLIEKRKSEIEISYKYVSILRDLTMAKILGQEKDGDKKELDGKPKYKEKIKGKELAAELSALSNAMKIIEESNTFQNKILGLTDHAVIASSVTREYEFQTRSIIERDKVEVERKKVTGNTDENEELLKALNEFLGKLERDKKTWE
ncbi:phage terminase small subunit-related protein [Fusobacterium ulcerans]|uniref:phage terminase small subunit-related protein n=1 Tax=Fusobacterium ulcerans TaxID=861 RepID=UPI0030EB88CF